MPNQRFACATAWAFLFLAITTAPAAALSASDAAADTNAERAYAHNVRFRVTDADTFFDGGERPEAAIRRHLGSGGSIEARYSESPSDDHALGAPLSQRDVTISYGKAINPNATVALSLSVFEQRSWDGDREDAPVAVRASLIFHAAEQSEDASTGAVDLISEVAVGAFAHNQGPFGADKESGTDFNAEVLLRSPHFLHWAGSPRPHIGVTVAGHGDATSYAYAGVTWDRNLPANFLVYASLGAAVHDGDPLAEDEARPGDKRRLFLGSRVLIRESAGIGLRFGDHWRAALQVEHMSNVRTADNNEGLDNLGLRLSYRF